MAASPATPGFRRSIGRSGGRWQARRMRRQMKPRPPSPSPSGYFVPRQPDMSQQEHAPDTATSATRAAATAAASRPQGVADGDTVARFRAFMQRHERLFVLTGAGISTSSGIPDYRDAEGEWKGAEHMLHQTFINSAAERKRYWARSMIGWQHVARAAPNAAHRVLARLQEQGRVVALVTQNVDGLHAAAGSRDVIDLHGRLDRVICLHCATRYSRRRVQELLQAANPDWQSTATALRPDGDVELGAVDYQAFNVPPCPVCGGVLKPDVVFFGGVVDKALIARAWQ